MDTPAFLSDRLQTAQFTRVVAFGSSNTERRVQGMHWFDCFELACRTTFGPHVAYVNSGRGGDSTGDLLSRFDRDCLAYQPQLVFLTVGGNDSIPDRKVTPETYRRNLRQIIQTLQASGCRPVVQTYYAFDLNAINPQHATAFIETMDIARDASRQTNCMLIDHLARWDRLRTTCYDVFRRLLVDPLHVNEAGNLLLGLDIARAFGLSLPDEPYFREARTTQALLDQLEGAKCR